MRAMRRPSVVFISTSRSSASLMGALLLRHRAGDRFDVRWASEHVDGVPDPHPLAIRVLQEWGIDVGHPPAEITLTALSKVPAQYAVFLCRESRLPRAQERDIGGERLYWLVQDPGAAQGSAPERLEAFRATRDQIDQRLEEWLRPAAPGTA